MQAIAAPPEPDLEPVADTPRPSDSRRPAAPLLALAAAVAVLLVTLTATRLFGLPSLSLPDAGLLRGLVLGVLVAVIGSFAVLLTPVAARTGGRPALLRLDALRNVDVPREPALPADRSAVPTPPADADVPAEPAPEADADVPAEPAPVADADVPTEPADPAALDDEAQTDAEVRTDAELARKLEFQVRCLEATLSEHDELLREALDAAAGRLEEPTVLEQQRVRSVLSAIRGAVADQRGDVAVARVEAALDRLGRPPRVARPLLSPSGHLPLTFAAPRPFALPGAPTPAAAAAPATTDPAPDQAPAGASAVEAPADSTSDAAADPAVVGAAPEPAAPLAPVKVLPVPAPLVPATAQRRRRGLRRSLM